MWNQEEVELSINNLSLFNEVCVDIGSLRRISNLITSNVEESLSDSLVNEDKSNFGELGLTVVVSNDSLQLGELLVKHLLSHGITNTVSVNENVVRQLVVVVLVDIE